MLTSKNLSTTGSQKLKRRNIIKKNTSLLKAIKKELGNDFIVLTPGIRPNWSNKDDQKRIVTPKDAINDGADFIVLGRAITTANDKIEAIKKVYNEKVSIIV